MHYVRPYLCHHVPALLYPTFLGFVMSICPCCFVSMSRVHIHASQVGLKVNSLNFL